MNSKSEYVFVKEYSILLAKLKSASLDFHKAIENASNAADLHKQKMEELEHAQILFNSIRENLNQLKASFPIREFKKEEHERPKRPITSTKLPEQELLSKSQYALQTLQKNLLELKEELKKIK
ncbi:MAG: hypothetical protein QXQ79_00140 [Candidatus Nanoarchaeia archaeon]